MSFIFGIWEQNQLKENDNGMEALLQTTHTYRKNILWNEGQDVVLAQTKCW